MKISKELIKDVLATLDAYGCRAHHPDLLPLLDQPESEPAKIDGNTSDGYHTFNELYEFRKAYNAALFNEWALGGKCSVHKSLRHHDGEQCFGGGWFIVVAVLPNGQISNHYRVTDWDLFDVPEVERALFEYDGHTGADTLERLKSYHPTPFTPITVDMVTDEMLAVYFDDDSMDWQNIPYPLVIAAKESCAGIINTFIKHRSKEMSIDSKIIAIQENKILELESQVEALRKDAEWKSIETAPKDVVLGFVPHQNENNGYVCPIIRTKENVWVNTSCPNFCEENPILWMPLPYPSDSAIKGEQAA